ATLPRTPHSRGRLHPCTRKTRALGTPGLCHTSIVAAVVEDEIVRGVFAKGFGDGESEGGGAGDEESLSDLASGFRVGGEVVQELSHWVHGFIEESGDRVIEKQKKKSKSKQEDAEDAEEDPAGG